VVSEKRTARPTVRKMRTPAHFSEAIFSASLGLKVTLNHKPGQEAGQIVLPITRP